MVGGHWVLIVDVDNTAFLGVKGVETRDADEGICMHARATSSEDVEI